MLRTIRGWRWFVISVSMLLAFGLSPACMVKNDKGNAGGSAGTAEAGAGGASGQSGGGASGVAGGDAGAAGTGSGLPGAEPGSWTYLVYMLADNDLEPFALDDLEEMMSVGSGGKLTILAEVDRAEGQAEGPIGGLPDFTSTKRVRVDAGALTELADLGELNLGSSQTFADFIAWGLAAAPAEHYAVVLWDHGGAWPQFGADFSANGDGLTLAELTSGLDAGVTQAGLLGPIDLFGFDACLMGGWEVAVALQSRARYLLGSEEVEPGHGWDHSVIGLLKNGADAEALGRALVDGYQAQAEQHGTSARITLSLTNLANLPALSTALGALSGALGDPDVATHAAVVGKARADIPTFGVIPGGRSSNMTDIGMLADALAALDPALGSSTSAVKSALAGAVVTQVQGQAFGSLGGLSLFFPERASDYPTSYDGLQGVQGWRSFVTGYYAAGGSAVNAPNFVNTDKVADVIFSASGLSVTGQLASGTFDNVASTVFDFGVADASGTAYFLGEEPADLSDTGLVSASWDTSVLALTQGADSDYGFYSLEFASNGVLSLAIPFLYAEGAAVNAVVALVISFDQNGQILSQTYYRNTDGAWAELVAAPGSTLNTLVPTLAQGASESEFQAQATAFDATQPIDLSFVTLPSQTPAFVELSATDYADQSDAVAAGGLLP